MDIRMIYEELSGKLTDAERILIGIGSEWKKGDSEREELIAKAKERIAQITEGKDFFVISTLSKEDTDRLEINPVCLVTPFDEGLTEEQWNLYMNWLSRTLNRKLVILELGEGFMNPTVVRWPFEKTTMINNKAHMYRVHKTFYQIADEIKEKATAVKGDSVEFMAAWESEGLR